MRVVVVDDHPLFRDGIASLLRAWGHEVVGVGSSAAEAEELAVALEPELVLMDVRMPGGNGIEATAAIKARLPSMRVVMLTVSEDEDDLFAAIKAGAQGYLLKNLEPSSLRSMLGAIARGEAAITPATAVRILEEFARHGQGGRLPGRRDPESMTAREVDVLRGVTAGLRNKEIATQLGISENTVKFHLRNILEKLHAESRAELAARAVREGLLPEERQPGS
jgi:DNA-binding NarL/FixJ family response regulator